MSTFNIRNIREISNDPLTKFTNHLAKKLAKFLVGQETDKLENKEDIYSDGQDIDSIIRFNNFSSQKSFDLLTQYFPTFEPDGVYNTCWIRGRNQGNEIPDKSTFGNDAIIRGDPLLIDGTPFDSGIHTYGVKSIALKLNRPTSEFENDEQVFVPDANNIQVLGITTGISYFIRFRVYSLASQGGLARTLFEKIDNTTPDDGVQAIINSDGSVAFSVKRAGTEYNKVTAAGAVTTNTVYDAWFTYANSGNVQHIYINNVDKSLSAGSSPTWHTPLTDYDLAILYTGGTSTGGHTYGDFYDFRVYRQKVVSTAEVGYMYTNKWTILDIPFGQVIVADYWATPNVSSPPGFGFTTAGFTTTGYTAG